MKWAVDQSGLSVIDDNIAGWFALRRTDPVVDAARETLGILRGSLLILVVALVAAALAWRHRSLRGDLVTVVSTAGAFVPLVLLAVISDVTRAGDLTAASSSVSGLFPSQNAVITAGFCTLAWLLSRRRHWPLRVALWTVAAAAIASLSGARLYLGWSVASETATSVLLGVMWTLFFMVAFASRDDGTTEEVAEAPVTPSPVGQLPSCCPRRTAAGSHPLPRPRNRGGRKPFRLIASPRLTGRVHAAVAALRVSGLCGCSGAAGEWLCRAGRQDQRRVGPRQRGGPVRRRRRHRLGRASPTEDPDAGAENGLGAAPKKSPSPKPTVPQDHADEEEPAAPLHPREAGAGAAETGARVAPSPATRAPRPAGPTSRRR